MGTVAELMPIDFKKDETGGWTRIKAVPDTGAVMNVAPSSMAPEFVVQPSEGSKRGQEFVAASGTCIPNEGEQHLMMQSPEGVWSRRRWQVAEVTRPLMSVGEECDNGSLVIFGKRGGIIMNMDTKEMQRFPRVNGSYEMEMWLPPLAEVQAAEANMRTSGFTGPGFS